MKHYGYYVTQIWQTRRKGIKTDNEYRGAAWVITPTKNSWKYKSNGDEELKCGKL